MMRTRPSLAIRNQCVGSWAANAAGLLSLACGLAAPPAHAVSISVDWPKSLVATCESKRPGYSDLVVSAHGLERDKYYQLRVLPTGNGGGRQVSAARPDGLFKDLWAGDYTFYVEKRHQKQNDPILGEGKVRILAPPIRLQAPEVVPSQTPFKIHIEPFIAPNRRGSLYYTIVPAHYPLGEVIHRQAFDVCQAHTGINKGLDPGAYELRVFQFGGPERSLLHRQSLRVQQGVGAKITFYWNSLADWVRSIVREQWREPPSALLHNSMACWSVPGGDTLRKALLSLPALKDAKWLQCPVEAPSILPTALPETPGPNPEDAEAAVVMVVGKQPFPLFNQLDPTNRDLYDDPDWASAPEDEMGTSRINWTCLAVVYAMIEHARGNTDYRVGTATYNDLGGGAVYIRGVPGNNTSPPSDTFIKAELAAGNPVVLQGNSSKIGVGHYMLAVGLDQDGQIIALDPYGGAKVTISPTSWSVTGSNAGAMSIVGYRAVDF